MDALTLLAVFAHPDDEAYGVGGTLAKYAAEGCDVHLATATRGEAGQIAPGVDASPATLPDVREHELRCACRSYGIHPPHLLGYMDGQLTIVHQGQAVGRLVRLLCRVRPQVVVTLALTASMGTMTISPYTAGPRSPSSWPLTRAASPTAPPRRARNAALTRWPSCTTTSSPRSSWPPCAMQTGALRC